MPLAFIGFAGGFAAPMLVSTGQGNHVGLFSYYLLLGVAIAGIAWVKAWRPLNLLGFFATFGVATAWGVLQLPAASTSRQHRAVPDRLLPAVYLLASLFYALRHGAGRAQAVDATLVFGTPIVAFGLQAGLVRDIPYATAFSSLALGALYLALGWWMARRARRRCAGEPLAGRMFRRAGLGFVTLAVPLALDGRWTSAVWAVEGAAVFWMGRRQGRWLARAAGLALQALAADPVPGHACRTPHGRLAASPIPPSSAPPCWPLAALAIAWWSREPVPQERGSALAKAFAPLENTAVAGAVLGRLPVVAGRPRAARSTAMPLDAQGICVPVFDARRSACMLHMLAWVLQRLRPAPPRLAARAAPWAIAATPAWLGAAGDAARSRCGAWPATTTCSSPAAGSPGRWRIALHLRDAAPAGCRRGRKAGGRGCTPAASGCWCCWPATCWCSPSAQARLWQTAWATRDPAGGGQPGAAGAGAAPPGSRLRRGRPALAAGPLRRRLPWRPPRRWRWRSRGRAAGGRALARRCAAAALRPAAEPDRPGRGARAWPPARCGSLRVRRSALARAGRDARHAPAAALAAIAFVAHQHGLAARGAPLRRRAVGCAGRCSPPSWCRPATRSCGR